MKKVENSKNPYEYWQARQRGENPPAYVEQPECGFYRKKNGGKQRTLVTYEPVAIFLDHDGKMVGRIGVQDNIKEIRIEDSSQYDLRDLWSWLATNDISEETYRAVAERGEPWPDAHDPKKNIMDVKILSGSEVAIARNKFLKSKLNNSSLIDIGLSFSEPPESEIINNLVTAKAGISQYDKIESDEMATRALSLKNEITSLASELDKVRAGLVRPHLDAQQEINGKLNPIIKDAKESSARLLQAIGSWEDQKRESSIRHPTSTNMPSPKAQIAPAVGRKASVKIVKVVLTLNPEKAWKQFGSSKEVYDVMMKLAQRMVDAGLPCDCAIIEERSIVR